MTPLSYYYILHGVVYQAPDLMSVLSSRLQTASHYLSEALDNSFSHYKYNPSKGYYWDFSQDDESKKLETQQKITQFQRDRVGPLLHEFFTRFPPTKTQEQEAIANNNENQNGLAYDANQTIQQSNQIEMTDDMRNEPVEKKKKI